MNNLFLTINGGSSSIKFALFEACDPPHRLLSGQVQRVGKPGSTISASGLGETIEDRPLEASGYAETAEKMLEFLCQRIGESKLVGIGHRVVHGGLTLIDHQVITGEVIDLLQKASEMDPDHLPAEISLIETCAKQFPGVPQIVCFDTAFFKQLPTVSKMLPIPRKYFEAGIHRFGFHGLSYTFLLRELQKLDPVAANGRVILAHLGSGASMAALVGGKPIDTSMAFTPTAGLVMGTRCGDLDPGLLLYLLRHEKWSTDQLDELLNKKSGMLGISDTSGDMRDLLAKRVTDPRARESVDVFCYQAKKWIGSLAAALGGVDTIVFAGGIGERSAETREQICLGLEFLGVEVDKALNAKDAPILSRGKVVVRVIRTDEEAVIAESVRQLTT